MLSGIGPASELATHGIPLVADLPGVGGNLMDHPAIGHIFHSNNSGLEDLPGTFSVLPHLAQWLSTGAGMLTASAAEVAAFIRYEPTPEDLAHGFQRNS